MNFDLLLTDISVPCGAVIKLYLNIPSIAFSSIGFIMPLPYSAGILRILTDSSDDSSDDSIPGYKDRLKYITKIFFVDSFYNHVPHLYYKDIADSLNMSLPHDFFYSTFKKSVVLVNCIWELDSVRPTMPSIIQIDLSLEHKNPDLPEDFKIFLQNSAPHGTILFSMGTHQLNLAEEQTQMLVRVFSRVKHRVIWKYDNDVAPNGLSQNVRIAKWVPQRKNTQPSPTEIIYQSFWKVIC